MKLCQLKHGVNIYDNRTFSRKLKEHPKGCVASLICKEEGNRLDKFLIKVPPGKTTNGVTHLKMHKKCLDAQGAKESEATKRKLKDNDED